MDFDTALHEVAINKRMVWRKIHQFEDDYDRPINDDGPATPWSIWMRIKLDDDQTDYDALIFFETRHRDDTTGEWFMKWEDDDLSRADIKATDWEYTTEEECN